MSRKIEPQDWGVPSIIMHGLWIFMHGVGIVPSGVKISQPRNTDQAP